jgi:hypothetical protein
MVSIPRRKTCIAKTYLPATMTAKEATTAATAALQKVGFAPIEWNENPTAATPMARPIRHEEELCPGPRPRSKSAPPAPCRSPKRGARVARVTSGATANSAARRSRPRAAPTGKMRNFFREAYKLRIEFYIKYYLILIT